MPKAIADWVLALFLAGVLVVGLWRTRLLAGTYCTICGGRLKRRACCYAGKPVHEITCPACGDHYIQTPWEKIPLK